MSTQTTSQTARAARIRGREREELADLLRQRTNGEVRFDPFSRVLYSTDASIYQMEPVGVVIPRSIDDVQAVMEVAREEPGTGAAPGRGDELGRADSQSCHRGGLQQVPEPSAGGEPGGRLGTGAAGHRAGPTEPAACPVRLTVRAGPPPRQTAPASGAGSGTTPRRTFRDIRQDLGPRYGGGRIPFRRYTHPLRPAATPRVGGQAQRLGVGVGHLPGHTDHCPGKS